MSVECSQCERDLRSGHADDCPRIRIAMKAFEEFFNSHQDEWEDISVRDVFLAGFQAGKKDKKK